MHEKLSKSGKIKCFASVFKMLTSRVLFPYFVKAQGLSMLCRSHTSVCFDIGQFRDYLSVFQVRRIHTNLRNTLLNETLSNTNLSVLNILHGDGMLNIRENMKLNDAVSKFITSTKRFNIYQVLYTCH